jgi:hypothetical protein
MKSNATLPLKTKTDKFYKLYNAQKRHIQTLKKLGYIIFNTAFVTHASWINPLENILSK